MNERNQKPDTSAQDVITLYQDLEAIGIDIWIDGGWGVDALLEKQTREHEDVDIVIEQKDVRALRKFLEVRGFTDVPRDDTSDWNFVLGDQNGRLVDVHSIVFDEHGNGLYGPVDKGVMYPAESLTGQGTIAGHSVRCISPDWMVKFHSRYELDENDFQDVSALCEKFGIPLPDEFARFTK
ncbi:MAG: nucleotidyltransferase domain-containing protein [Anaerolineales bacterium]